MRKSKESVFLRVVGKQIKGKGKDLKMETVELPSKETVELPSKEKYPDFLASLQALVHVFIY